MTDFRNAPTDWDLSHLLKGDDDPNIEKFRNIIAKKSDEFALKWKDRNDYLADPTTLKEALDEYCELSSMQENGAEAFYFGLRSAQDSISTEIRAKENKSEEFTKQIMNKVMFFNLNLSKIDSINQEKILNNPQLKEYKHFIERKIAVAKHRLSEPEEKILMLKSGPAYGKWVQLVDNSLNKEERTILNEDGEKVTATLEEMLTLTSSPQNIVRESAGNALSDIFASTADLAEAEINAILANKKIDDELRGFDRPEQSRLMADDIDLEIVDALIEAVSEKYDLSIRYMDLKAKLLKQPKFRYFERALGYGEVEKDYSYEESMKLVDSVLNDLDPQFSKILKNLSENGLIDVFPKKGKRGGAFCAGLTKTLPTFVMLNHTNKLRDVTTIAHEIGHAINNELMKLKQNELNFATPLSTAEVASTFMEDFVFDRLLMDASEEEELALRVSQLQDQIATIFRQVAAYRFEQDLHKEFRVTGYVSKEKINEVFCKHMKDYLGDHSEGAENWWVYWSHIRHFFYVYSYASGLLISKSLQSKVKKDKSFIGNVKEFLSSGTSKSPKEIFLGLGLDITNKNFWEDGLAEIESQIQITEQLAIKLGKI